MRSLLLHVDSGADFTARLQVALDLCRSFDAHVTLLQTVVPDIAPQVDMNGVILPALGSEIRREAEELRERIEARLANEDVRWDWVVEWGLASNYLLRHAALTDLAIVGAHDPGSLTRGPSPIAGMLAVHCKAPIMVVPDKVSSIDIGGPAMVCWNGSIEASRALRAATPLLGKASAVHLVTVSAKEEDTFDLPATAGARYLERHGVNCEMVEIPCADDAIGETLRDAARAREAAWLVMGAYGTPRLIETLFGGVTREMLREPEWPTLLAH